MAEQIGGDEEIVSFEELLLSNTMEQEALVNLLVRKGIITRQELLEELKKINQE
jgi:hypothetical protein